MKTTKTLIDASACPNCSKWKRAAKMARCRVEALEIQVERANAMASNAVDAAEQSCRQPSPGALELAAEENARLRAERDRLQGELSDIQANLRSSLGAKRADFMRQFDQTILGKILRKVGL